MTSSQPFEVRVQTVLDPLGPGEALARDLRTDPLGSGMRFVAIEVTIQNTSRAAVDWDPLVLQIETIDGRNLGYTFFDDDAASWYPTHSWESGVSHTATLYVQVPDELVHYRVVVGRRGTSDRVAIDL